MARTLSLLMNSVVTIKTGEGTYLGTVSWVEDSGVWIIPTPTFAKSDLPPLGKMSIFFPFAQMNWLAVPD